MQRFLSRVQRSAPAVVLVLALVGVALPAYAAAPVAPVERPPGPTRVMLAGDSITQGRAGDYTYRYWL